MLRVQTGAIELQDHALKRERGFSVHAEDNVVTIAKFDSGEESLAVEFSTESKSMALFLKNALSGQDNPMLMAQEQFWDHPSVTGVKIILPGVGEIQYTFDGKAPILPEAPGLVPIPSKLVSEVTGLPLAAGFVRSLDGVDLDPESVLTVFEIDVGNLGLTNDKHGPAFTDNGLLSKLKALASQISGMDICQPGGDEFSGYKIGNSAAENQRKIELFRELYLEKRDELLSHLTPEQRKELEIGAEEKRIKKNRKHATAALDMYLATASIEVNKILPLLEVVDRGVILVQMLGKVDDRIYGMKDSTSRINHQVLEEISHPRSADVEAVEHVRSIDSRAKDKIDYLKNEKQSFFERVAAYVELVRICAEDAALDHGILRGNRLDTPVSLRGTIRDTIKQFMPEATLYEIDFKKFGQINDLAKSRRADAMLLRALKNVHLDKSFLLERVSGGQFLLILPAGNLDDRECQSVRESIARIFDMDVHATELALGKTESIEVEISFRKAA